jgi:hypothetical protein
MLAIDELSNPEPMPTTPLRAKTAAKLDALLPAILDRALGAEL